MIAARAGKRPGGGGSSPRASATSDQIASTRDVRNMTPGFSLLAGDGATPRDPFFERFY